MLVSGECCRWAWVRACFALLKVHAFNETARDGIDMLHLAVRNDVATKAFHELMDFNFGNAAFLLDDLKWFHARIELLPLTGPVGSNLFFADETPAFRALGPANVFTHERQGAVYIPTIEGRVCLSDQCLCVRHESSGVHMSTLHIDERNDPEVANTGGYSTSPPGVSLSRWASIHKERRVLVRQPAAGAGVTRAACGLFRSRTNAGLPIRWGAIFAG